MKVLSLAVCLLTTVASMGCDQLELPSIFGIVRTNAEGVILEDDPSDWQPRCTIGTGFCVTPLMPNLVESRRSSSFEVMLSQDVFLTSYIEVSMPIYF